MARYKLPIPSLAGTLVLTASGAAHAQPETTAEVAQPQGPAAAASEGVDTPVEATVPEPPGAASTEPPPVTSTEAPAVAPTEAPATPVEDPFVASDDERAPRVEVGPRPEPVRTAERLIPRGSKRSYFEFNVGSVHSMFGYGSYYGYGNFGATTHLEQVIGRYVGASKTDGFGVGFLAIERIGGIFSDYTLGLRLQWDRPLSETYGVYLCNSFSLGFNMSGYGTGLGVIGFGVDAMYSAGAKLLIKDRLSLSFKPINIDFLYNSFLFINLRFSVLGGIGVTF